MKHYVIIIGSMKSGTTSLFDLLARHPQIAPAREKEPGFFAFDGVFARGWEWYDGLFDATDQHRYRLEASTDYTKVPFATGVWERMTSRPDVSVKLLYIMRDPLRRMESHARHTQGTLKELGQLVTPKADHSLDAGVSSVNLTASRYATQLDQFSEAWAAGNLHCLTLEELKSDPEATLARIGVFLDLDPAGFGESAPASNKAGTRRETSGLWTQALRLKPLVALGKVLLPNALRQRIRNAAHPTVRSDGRFAFTADEETLLMDLLAPEIDRLASHYGVDVTRWSGANTQPATEPARPPAAAVR